LAPATPKCSQNFYLKKRKKEEDIFRDKLSFLGIFWEELATLQIFKTWLECIASFSL
jgi:hypothetical protein